LYVDTLSSDIMWIHLERTMFTCLVHEGFSINVQVYVCLSTNLHTYVLYYAKTTL